MIDRHGPASLALAADSGIAAGDMNGPTDAVLDDEDRARLVHAIETALEISGLDGFQDWLRGPFAALLPNDAVVCLELGEDERVRQLACAHHRLIEAATMDALHHAEHRLAAHLALTGPPAGTAFAVEMASAPLPGMRNALVCRFRLLAGNDYACVLINVADDRLERSLRLFRLLASHLKAALARAMPPRRSTGRAPVTARELEILGLMAAGRSNREIAGTLAINPITLKQHIARLYRKLDVQSRTEAVARGLAGRDDGA